MSLQDTLNAMKAKAEAGMPPHVKAVMHKANEDLVSSGILDKVRKVGETMVDFTLMDEQDREVRSASLLEKGPLVLSFYRGVW